MVEELFAAGLRLHGLHRVLLKRRDPLSHVLFASLFTPAAHAPRSGARWPHGAAASAPQGGAAAGGGGAAGGGAAGGGAAGGGAAELAALLEAFPDAQLDLLAQDTGLPPLVERTAATAPAGAEAAAAEAAGGGGGGGAAAEAKEAEGLWALWAPLSTALREAFEHAAVAAPVRTALAAELPRLLHALLAVSTRIESHLYPATLPAEGRHAFGAEALLHCAAALQPQARRRRRAHEETPSPAALSLPPATSTSATPPPRPSPRPPPPLVPTLTAAWPLRPCAVPARLDRVSLRSGRGIRRAL